MAAEAVSLLDVNVLVALFDADHIHHDLAHGWFAEKGSKAWATCPTTEIGFLRVLSNPAYHGPNLRSKDLAERLRQFCGTRGHHAWPDAVSLYDGKLFDLSYVGGHRQLTDVYLVGLARHMKGRLATFDRNIPLKAIVGAKAEVLQIIEP